MSSKQISRAARRRSTAPGKEIEMNEWQDISTAPKDGDFLAFYPAEDGEPSFMEVTHWPDGSSRLSVYFGMTIGGVDPTHWMPLPNPPVDTETK